MTQPNNVLLHADHVKVYFKGKDKKSSTVKAVDDITFDIMRLRKKYFGPDTGAASDAYRW